MGDEQDNLLTAGPGWGLGHAGRAGGSGGATGGAVAGGWGQAGGSGQGWWFGGSPHEGSGSEQEGLRVPQAQGSGDRQGQWLEGFWWYTHVGTVPGDVWRCHRWHGGPGVGTGRDSGPGGLQCCWHRPCLCSRSGDRGGTAWWGQDRTEGVPKCFQSAFNARGWGGGKSYSQRGGAGGRGGRGSPAPASPRGAGTAGERDENGDKTGYGEGIPTGAGPRPAAGLARGGGYSLARPMMARM